MKPTTIEFKLSERFNFQLTCDVGGRVHICVRVSEAVAVNMYVFVSLSVSVSVCVCLCVMYDAVATHNGSSVACVE